MAFGRKILSVASGISPRPARVPLPRDVPQIPPPQEAQVTGDRPSDDTLRAATFEFAKAVFDTIGKSDTPHGPRVHQPTALAVIAAVVGQAAVRHSCSAELLQTMPDELPVGIADGPIYADAFRGRDTLFHLLAIPARGVLQLNQLPNPYDWAQQLRASGLPQLPADWHPKTDPLAAMPHYDAVAHAIARREGFDTQHEMLMAAGALLVILNGIKDPFALKCFIGLSFHTLLAATRINPTRHLKKIAAPTAQPEANRSRQEPPTRSVWLPASEAWTFWSRTTSIKPLEPKDGGSGSPILIFPQDITADSIRGLHHALINLVEGGAGAVSLVIGSSGGLLAPCLRLYRIMRHLPIAITTHAVGTVASAANILFLAGSERIAAPNAKFMFHAATIGRLERVDQASLEQSLQSLKDIETACSRVYAEQTRLSHETIESFRHGDVYFDAQQALDLGIINKIETR